MRDKVLSLILGLLIGVSMVQAKAENLRPIPGTTLSCSSCIQFCWETGLLDTASWVYFGTARGSSNLYNSGQLSGVHCITPCNLTRGTGDYVWMRVWTRNLLGWSYVDAWYGKSSCILTGHAIRSPERNTLLPCTSPVTFTWSGGVNVQQVRLKIGTSSGASDIFDSGSLPGSASSALVPIPIPAPKSILYATLQSTLASGAIVTDPALYYTAAPELSRLTAPAAGSQLTNSTAQFCWTAGCQVTARELTIGSSAGANDILQKPLVLSARCADVSGLPTDGRILYATLWSTINGAKQTSTCTFRAAQSQTGIQPTPPGPLSCTRATLSWSQENRDQCYWLYVGRTSGSADLVNTGSMGMTRQIVITGLPFNATIYVTLWRYKVGMGWSYKVYPYRTQ